MFEVLDIITALKVYWFIILVLQCSRASFQPPQFEEKENIRSSSGTTTNYSSNEKRINIVSG